MSEGRARTGLEIAVVGMAGRFPGADSVSHLWRNLRAGVESVTRFSRSDLQAAGVDQALLDDPAYVRARGVLDNVDCFDAALFGYSPREARLMDPQHRLFLECAWEALEDAGWAPRGDGRLIGVFASAGFNAYLLNLHSRRGEPGYFDSAEVLLGNEKDHVATRVAYKLDLSGPSMAIQTACSSSLVAVHQACRSLLVGDCDGALAGGVFVAVPQHSGYLWAEGGALSRDGHCRAFDAAASGFVPGSGVGIVFLRRLEDAEAAGDPIRAVILGSAANNDGASKVGYTAPSVVRQAEAVAAAYRFAEVDPATVGYVETHGAATELGDPIEVEALRRAFGAGAAGPEPCWLGSVKTNLGHLDAAAGVAGLIKTVLCLEHGEIAPSLHFESPNPRIPFAKTRFRVARELVSWQSRPWRAGVSSLGLGGTNVHLVLESCRNEDHPVASRSWHVLPVSAASATSLKGNLESLGRHLEAAPQAQLAQVAHTLQVGRLAMRHRQAVVCDSVGGAWQELARLASGQRAPAQVGDEPRVVFMFPGGGAQHLGMARQIFAAEAVFRDEVQRCCAQLAPQIAVDLVEALFGCEESDTTADLADPVVGLPALFVVEVALARLWQSWGVLPAAMIGHSLGEYAAAHLAGVLSLADALSLVARRGQLFATLPAGAMVSVHMAEDELCQMLGGELELAAVNGPELCTVAGPREAVSDLEARLAAREVVCRRVPIDVASHCTMVRPMLGPLAELLSTIQLRAPRLPYVSNLTGRWVEGAEVQRPGYWTEHLSRTVRFSDGLATVVAEPGTVLLEVGPGQTLTRLAQGHPQVQAAGAQVLPSLPHASDAGSDHQFLLESLGSLWCGGFEIDWEALSHGSASRRVSLPTYCFERTRYWVEAASSDAPRVGKSDDVSSWFYLPGLSPALRPPVPTLRELEQDDSLWLVFTDDSPLAEALCGRLAAARKRPFCVRPGDALAGGDGVWLRPGEPEDYRAMAVAAGLSRARQVRVLHLWQRGDPALGGEGGAAFALSLATGYSSLVCLARELIRCDSERAHVTVVTSGITDASGGETIIPERATLLGPALVLPQEAPHVGCRVIDLPRVHALPTDELADLILAEAWDTGGPRLVALQGRWRASRSYHRVALPPPRAAASRLRRGGRYLLIGGLGPVGLHVARYLARTLQARLCLMNRSALPPREEWQASLVDQDCGIGVGRRIRAILEMEEAGAGILLVQGDVAEDADLERAVRTVESEWGALDGVLHCASASQDASVNTAIVDLDAAGSETQFEAKVHGLYALARALEGRSLDFCVVFSSNAALLGGLGMTAYTAANSFVDAFCARRRARGEAWMSVTWDEWLVEDRVTDERSGGGLHDYAMSPEQSLDALERALLIDGVGHLVVSTGELESRLAQWVGSPAIDSEKLEASDSSDEVAAAEARGERPAPLEPRSADESVLLQIWKELLGVDRVGVEDNFFSLGGHSLLAVHLRAKVKKRLGRDLPLEAIFRSGTVAGMAAALTGEDDCAPQPRSLVSLRAGGSNPALYLVHAASGSAHVYVPLSRHLGDDQPLFAFQARGLDGSQTPFAGMDEMVSAYLAELVQQQPTDPYLLGGWCAGGAIAYEMAQRLVGEGHEVHLALIDVGQPDDPGDSDDTRDLFAIARTHARNLGVDMPLRREDLDGLSSDAQLGYVLEQYKLFEVAPLDATVETLRAQWDVFLATLRITRGYRFSPFPGRIALFLAEELDYHRLVDMEVAQDFTLDQGMRAEYEARADAWRGYSPHPVEVFMVPGYHSLMALEPHVEGLADRLLQWIEGLGR